MIRYGLWTWLVLGGIVVTGLAQDPGTPVTNTTVITANRLIFEQQKRMAVFEEQVEVQDREITIRADRLTVFFTDDHKLDHIEAEGRLVIEREDVRAVGEQAHYDVAEGRLTLTGNPRVQRGQDVLSGETITLWRASRRILCEPNARLVIVSEPEAWDALRR